MIVSPLQQLTFSCVVVTTAYLIFKISRLLLFPPLVLGAWVFSYFAGQGLVSLLPDSVNYKQINIFFKKGARELYTGFSFFADELESNIKNRTHLEPSPQHFLEVVIEEVLGYARQGKIPGFTAEHIEDKDPAFFQFASRLVVFEIISTCNPGNEKIILSELRGLSGRPMSELEKLNETEKSFNLVEIEKCKEIFIARREGKELTEEIQTFFNGIGKVATACLQNPDFYRLLH